MVYMIYYEMNTASITNKATKGSYKLLFSLETGIFNCKKILQLTR